MTPGRRLAAVLRPGPGVVVAAALAGLAWSWRTWPDPTVDFGRELYVPWRLASGDVLYRDIVSFNGPLSPYLVAGWFSLTGESLLSLVAMNAAVLAATLVLAYALLARAAGAGAATLACLGFLGAFAFGQLGPAGMVPAGNYNWICPYSHELTHGIALALLGLLCGLRFAERGRLAWAVAAGLARGAVFLTKAEVFAAALGASALGLGATLRLERAPRRRALRVLGVFAAGALAPPAASALLLATAMPFGEALRGTLGTWPHLLEASHTGLPYFRWGMGTDDPAARLGAVLEGCVGYAAWVVPALALARTRPGRRGAALPAAVFAVTAGALATAWLALGWIGWFDGRALFQWSGLARPWQLLLAGAGVALAWPVWRGEVEPAERPAAALRLALVGFALLLLAKMILNVRVFHYGFALAAPAAWIVVALFWSWLPARVGREGGRPAVLRAAFLALWGVALAAHLQHAGANLAAKGHVVGTGADAFRAPPRGELVDDALDWLARQAGPGETLAALPEGIILNYLSRRRNPTPFLQFTPPLIALYGEERMIAALEASPPDWIALVHRSDADYGTPFFGADYGAAIRAWVARHYAAAARFGAPPFRGPRFGIVLLKRRG